MEPINRPPILPPGVLESRKLKRQRLAISKSAYSNQEDSDVDMEVPAEIKPRLTARERELAGGEDYVLNLREHWLLPNPEQINDVIPEIINGRNVIDYMFDPDIEERLNELERQEAAFEASGAYAESDWGKEERDLPEDERARLKEIRNTAKKQANRLSNFA
ncbi:unnamed protein product [Protopolystoma xenopodis]|uniref:NOG C-terminal domain-containing protein n=1 Tax=Protopolystoma xenopodis TaxID=117903 RepID=A0A3S5AFJ2_9PLAT|nr:unnamed protein product [Protopolystoma xenopodis]